MKIDITQVLIKAGQTTHLTDEEGIQLERVVSGYVAMKPLQTRGLPSHTFLSRTFMWRGYVGAGLVFAIASSGTISYAAESSLPGDVLYPVKVGVNEKIAVVITRSASEKVALEARLAGKRLDEAARLAIQNRLTPEHQATLEVDFERHAENATRETENFGDDDSDVAINVASRFESELASHVSILSVLDHEGDTVSLKRAIREKASRLSKFRFEAESRSFASADSIPAVSVMAMKESSGILEVSSTVSESPRASTTSRYMGDVAKKSYASVKKRFDDISTQFDTSRVEGISSLLIGASEGIVSGDVLQASGKYAEAFHEYQKSFSMTQKLLVYIKTMQAVHPQRIPEVRFFRADDGMKKSKGSTEEHRGEVFLPKQLDISSFQNDDLSEIHNGSGGDENRGEFEVHSDESGSGRQ